MTGGPGPPREAPGKPAADEERRAVRVRALWALSACVGVAAGVLRTLAGGEGVLSGLAMLASLGVVGTVGAFVALRRPTNPIGRIYLAGSGAAALGLLASAWVDLARGSVGGLPGAAAAVWMKNVLYAGPLVVLATFPPLLFPDGRLPSRRWRPVLWAAVLGAALVTAYPALMPGPLDADPAYPHNPLGLEPKAALQALNAVGMVLVAAAVLAAVVSLFARFRRARDLERQQLKWLAAGVVLTLIVLFVAGPGYYGGFLPALFRTVLSPFAPMLMGAAFAVLPLVIGAAILRLRLYEIDRIVSRTLGYAIVVAVLAGAYGAIVVGLGTLLQPLTGGDDLAVAASTLAAAAAFGPVRRRVHAVVDRRFNRARYDAAKTIDAFGARMRDEVDVDALLADLRTAIYRTMQPSSVSLWLARAL